MENKSWDKCPDCNARVGYNYVKESGVVKYEIKCKKCAYTTSYFHDLEDAKKKLKEDTK